MSHLPSIVISQPCFTIGGVLVASLVYYLRFKPKNSDSSKRWYLLPPWPPWLLGTVLVFCQDEWKRWLGVLMDDSWLSPILHFHNDTMRGFSFHVGMRHRFTTMSTRCCCSGQNHQCDPCRRLCIHLGTPDCLKYVLLDNSDNYEKGVKTRSFQHTFLGGNGDATRKWNHRIAMTATNADTVRYSINVLLEKLEKMERLLDDWAESKHEFDFHELSSRMILDVFIKTAFGFDLNCIEENDHTVPFVEAFNQLQWLIQGRLNDPLWEIKQYLAMGEREQRIKRCERIINDFADEIINVIRSGDFHNRPDVASSFLFDAFLKGDQLPTNEDVRDLVIGIMIGGRDATAAALSWTIFELIKHPAVMRCIREEVNQVTQGAQLTLTMAQKLPYTDAVVLESLRLHPPVPYKYSIAKKEDVLPNGTKVPAGSLVFHSTNVTTSSQQSQSLDPNSFDPDRFLRSYSEPSQAYQCPARVLTVMQLKMCLAYLLPRYDFIDSLHHPGAFDWTIVITLKGGLRVHVRKRITTRYATCSSDSWN